MALLANALTTVGILELELGLTPGSETAKLERIIDATSAFVSSYCRREFHKQTAVAEIHPGHGSFYLHTKLRPILTLTSIAFDGDALDSSNYEIYDASAGIIYIKAGAVNSGALGQSIGGKQISGTERKLYTITFDGGYITREQDSATRTLPADLEDAVIMTCVWRYHSFGADQSIKSEKVLNETQSKFDLFGATDLVQRTVPLAWQILQRYKSWT